MNKNLIQKMNRWLKNIGSKKIWVEIHKVYKFIIKNNRNLKK